MDHARQERSTRLTLTFTTRAILGTNKLWGDGLPTAEKLLTTNAGYSGRLPTHLDDREMRIELYAANINTARRRFSLRQMTLAKAGVHNAEHAPASHNLQSCRHPKPEVNLLRNQPGSIVPSIEELPGLRSGLPTQLQLSPLRKANARREHRGQPKVRFSMNQS